MAQISTFPRDDDGKLPEHAFPGGYPLFYTSDDGRTWCPGCASDTDADPDVTHGHANWEDPELYCDGCGKRIPSAYGDDDDS